MTAKKTAKKSVKKPAAAEVKESVLPTHMLLHPRELDFSVPSWVKTVFLALLFFLLFQLLVGGCRLAGKAVVIYRQFEEFRQQWKEKNLPIPNPDGDGIRKYIRKNFPRTIPAKERESAAQVFADAADAVDAGDLINRDDVLGYLGGHLQPVCRAPAWIAFLGGVWTELDADAGDSPGPLAESLREAARGLSEARSFVLVEAVEDLEPEPSGSPGGQFSAPGSAVAPAGTAANEQPPIIANPGSGSGSPGSGAEEPQAEEKPEETPKEPAPAEEPKASSQNCPSGTCPANSSYQPYYGGYRWW